MRVPRPATVSGLVSGFPLRFGQRNRRRSQFLPTVAATLLVASTTSITVAPVPKPAAIFLLGIGFAGASILRFYRHRETH